MDESKEKYWQLIDSHITPVMIELGFKKKKREFFYAVEGECTKRVACGFNKARGEDAGSAVFSVCVGFKVLQDFLSRCPELDEFVNFFPGHEPCTMAANLGHIAPPFKYLAWNISPQSGVQAVASEVITRIRRDGFKYFSEYGTLDRVVAAWKSGTTYNMGDTSVLYLTAHEWLFGQRQTAIEQLRDAISAEELPSSRNIYLCLLKWLEAQQSGGWTTLSHEQDF